MTPLTRVIDKLRRVRQLGEDRFVALCPAHDDTNPSLSVSLGHDGRVLLYCHAGCRAEDVLAQLELTFADLSPIDIRGVSSPVDTKIQSRSAEVVATYDYCDATGKLLFQVVRYQPKRFRQRRPDGNGGWVWNLKGVDPVLYRLPEVLAGIISGKPIYVVEGEKDADALTRLGFCATTAPMGAGKWRPNYTAVLSGAHVVLIPDYDTPGREHMDVIATSCFPIAASVRVIELGESRIDGIPRLPPKSDVSDWLRLGGTRELLEHLTRAATAWTPCATVDGAEEEPYRFPLTELGNAERLVHRHGGDLRYVPETRRWLVWDTCHWREDYDGEIIRRATETVRAISDEVRIERDPDRRNQLARHCMASESLKRVENMIKFAQSRPGIPVSSQDLNQEVWLLNVLNGTIDLRSGRLERHRREHLFTHQIGLEFHPLAACPTWMSFLGQVMDGDHELISYLQRVIGYCLTGSIREHAFWIHHGVGRNGKSTFLDTFRALLGPYATVADFETFLSNRNRSGPRDDIADLAGARLVTASEAAEGRSLDDAVLKQITGGDPIRARKLHKDGFVYSPTYKIHVAANHLPTIRGDDEGIWSRVHRVPWRVIFPQDQQDKELPGKLRNELAGIFAWAVRGCVDWQQGGLQPPKIVIDATVDYRREMDVVSSFLAECCVSVSGARVAAGDLYARYKTWSEQIGERPLAYKPFLNRLRQRGLRETQPGHKVHFHDLSLLDSEHLEISRNDSERGGR